MGACECCLGYCQYVYGQILILCIHVLHYFPDCSQFDAGRWPSSVNHSFVLSLSLPNYNQLTAAHVYQQIKQHQQVTNVTNSKHAQEDEDRRITRSNFQNKVLHRCPRLLLYLNRCHRVHLQRLGSRAVVSQAESDHRRYSGTRTKQIVAWSRQSLWSAKDNYVD